MAAATELDPSLKQALNFLHSTNPQSAEDIRNCLDEIIKQRYGSSKMLANTISRKHLDEEPQAPGTVIIPIEIEDLTITQSPKTISDSPNTIAESDDMGGALTISEEVENLKEFGDLKCVVCGEMIVTATNRLIECSKCGSLYHQMCHNPNITDEEADEQELSWTCTNCQSKSVPTKMLIDESVVVLKTKSSSASSSRSSSSSTSSSPYYRQEHSSSSSSKHKGSSLTKSHSSKESSSTASASKSSVITPSINVISADKTSYSSKKSSSHSSSSSKSKSRHHEGGSSSGSSKRKSSK